MTIYTVINDTHIGSTEATHTYEEILDIIKKSEYPVILLGDIVDMKNCKKKEVDIHLECLANLYSMVAYKVSGNHDPQYGDRSINIVNVRLEHGDFAFWGDDKANKFRAKPSGAGFFKRNILIHLIDDARCLIDPGPNKLFTQYCSYLKTQGFKKIIVGHRHPKKTLTGTISGLEYMILKRGVNLVDL